MSHRIYLDNAATQPLRPEAQEAMAAASQELNPAGQYATGRAARRAVEEAREQIAELLGADPAEVIFTGSGTEANNIAVQGLAFGALGGDARTLASPAIEHPAVAESVAWLVDGLPLGFRHKELLVDAHGVVETVDLATWHAESPLALVTCMWANNETGNFQPVERLAHAAAEIGVPFHTDAVQVVGHQPVNFRSLGASTLAASAHKFGGPRAGLLLARRDAPIVSPVRGGGQERKLRSGTVNVQAAVGTAVALAAAHRDMHEDNARMASFRESLMERIQTIEGVRVWTVGASLPSHVHMSFPGAEGDSLIMLLDAARVDASTGSACSAGVNRASHVLAAMGVPVDVARGALRLTLGPQTTAQDVERVAELLPRVVEQARAAGMAF